MASIIGSSKIVKQWSLPPNPSNHTLASSTHNNSIMSITSLKQFCLFSHSPPTEFSLSIYTQYPHNSKTQFTLAFAASQPRIPTENTKQILFSHLESQPSSSLLTPRKIWTTIPLHLLPSNREAPHPIKQFYFSFGLLPSAEAQPQGSLQFC